MPRTARKIGETGVYHIMLRGINRQIIFQDDKDILRFLDTLRNYKELSGFQLFAYCIMDNHVHLLIKESDEPMSTIVKRISSSYVFWYNKRYERCGHLFQERFRSEAVDDDEYFLTVLRYIHQNPVKAEISDGVDDYKWSSYKEYIEGGSLTDTSFALDMLSCDRKKAVGLFKEFCNQRNSDACLEYDAKITVSDSELVEYLRKKDINAADALKILSPSIRDGILKELKTIEGVNVRQLARVTGLSKSTINRA